MGLVVERPDVGESESDFTVTPRPGAMRDKVIRFGLGAVKGVGVTAVEAVLEAPGPTAASCRSTTSAGASTRSAATGA